MYRRLVVTFSSVQVTEPGHQQLYVAEAGRQQEKAYNPPRVLILQEGGGPPGGFGAQRTKTPRWGSSNVVRAGLGMHFRKVSRMLAEGGGNGAGLGGFAPSRGKRHLEQPISGKGRRPA
jgi:hypothetical protein